MASIWPQSRTPFLDPSGAPMVGAQLSFYDEGTLTTQVVYADSALSTPRDQPILADARGMFPIIFLNPTPGSYRQRLLDADDVTIFDDDGVSVPQAANFVAPDAGSTSESLLLQTGMLQPFYGTTAPDGWVRAAGRTIGSASSGASERANADCEDLFLHLWTADANLAVSTGRGGSAASDWAANKTIALPDLRERTLAGLATMGNSDAGLVADSLMDSGTSSDLGKTAGADDVTLTSAQIPAHNHTATFTGQDLGNHTHNLGVAGNRHGANGVNIGLNLWSADGDQTTLSPGTYSVSTANQSAGTPVGTVAVANNTGGGGAHQNMQPTMFVTMLIKL